MVYIPAIFFGLLFFHSILNRGWNIEAFLYLIFFITGVASIILDAQNLYDYNCLKKPLGIAPLFYCLLLWLCIRPFGDKLHNCRINEVVIRNERILDLATYFYFAVFIIVLYVSFTNISQIIVNTSLAQVRQDAYHNDNEFFYSHLQGIPRYICALTTFFFASSFFMLVVFFVNVLFRKTKWYINVMALLGSTTQLITGITQADRSQVVYWGVMFVVLFTFFYKSIRNGKQKSLLIYVLPLFSLALVYLVAVSLSRWGDSDAGAEGGTIRYLGMNYFNFCNFFNNFWGTPHSLCELFPLSYKLSGGADYFAFGEYIESRTGVFVLTFSTFLGYICSISGPIVMFLYCLFYNRLASSFLKRKEKTRITFHELTKFWVVVLVPACGFFCYHYSFYTTTIALVIWFMISHFTKSKINVKA